MLTIKPIELLKGSHADTGQTGRGCFMNVIAYLNNEPTITDASTCVCVTVRPIAIWLNDFMTDAERPQLLPFILRALGSATTDKDELVRRTWLCAHYAQRQAEKAAARADARAAMAERADARAAMADARAAMAAWAAWAERAAWAAGAAASAARAAWAARAAGAAASAARAAACAAASAVYTAVRAYLIADTLALLNNILPPLTEPQAVHVERINRLAELRAAARETLGQD